MSDITKKNIFSIALHLAAIVQVVLALVAEYNNEYDKAIYEMLWVGVLSFLIIREENKDE
jgi:hypothetical protein|tara:strand:+ start:1075 stop:1254 length:180 start_codon:yes stop_codon:yes gene_type:complete